jgi:hypothetical protein
MKPETRSSSVPALLTFSGAMEWDPAIAAYFDGRTPELVGIARRWFAQMRGCGPDVRELLHDGCATVCVDDAPFAYVSVFKAHVNVGFFHGDALRDPKGLLEGTGRFMRHVKLEPQSQIAESALTALIAAAYRDIKARLKAAR